MRNRHLQRRRLITLTTLWTMVLGLVLASVLPSGTMASRSADGTLVIEICAGNGTALVALAADGTVTPLPGGPAKTQSMPDCAWAAAHALGVNLPTLGWALHQPDQTQAMRPIVPETRPTVAAIPRSIQAQAPPAPVI